jgi:hypothetical protein
MSNPPTCLAVDYGSTISTAAIDHLIGEKPVDQEAAAALRTLHDDHDQRIILASKHNTRRKAMASPPGRDRRTVPRRPRPPARAETWRGLPDEALLIRHVSDLPPLLRTP